MAVVGMITSVIGLGLNVFGQMQQTQAMKRNEKLRMKQMNLEAMRQRRDIIRNASVARATALNSAAAQGAQYGSGVPGGQGQIQGRAGNQLVAANQNQDIGAGIFKNNRQAYDASVVSSIGGGLQSLGGMFLSNAGTFDRVGQVGYV